MSTNKAMRSFFGSSGGREQTVFTPDTILQVPKLIWGRIAYDPCHGSPGSVLTKAGRDALADKALPAESDEMLADQGYANLVESHVDAARRSSTHGLIDAWPDKSFVNCPYKTLGEWLAMSLAQESDHIMLIPVRPNRVWWRAWARKAEIVYLNPVKFLGHDQMFPAPLCLARRNSPTPGQMSQMATMMGLGGSI